MSVGTDPRYQRLADRVVIAWSIPGPAVVDIKRAILAQWQCEQPANAWPPLLNNPGYVTVGALDSVGARAETRASCGKQYPRFCLARFPTPDDGARAYALLILRGHRYAAGLAEARAGHGLGFLNKITAAGYGTRYTCCRSAYASLGGHVDATTAGATTALDFTGLPAWLNDPGHVITAGDVAELRAALVAKNPGTSGLGFYLDHLLPDFIGKPVSALLAEAYGLFKAGGVSSGDLAPPGSITFDAPAIIAGIGVALGGVVRNGLFLVFALVALLLGLWILATANDQPGGLAA